MRKLLNLKWQFKAHLKCQHAASAFNSAQSLHFGSFLSVLSAAGGPDFEIAADSRSLQQKH